jgi:hypothetical protein
LYFILELWPVELGFVLVGSFPRAARHRSCGTKALGRRRKGQQTGTHVY